MAKLNSIIQFTGSLGNVIAYRRGGNYCLRTRPESVRQTDNTRRSAQWFGAASKKGAFIRSAFADELDIPHYGAHVNQLNKTIVNGGRNNHAALKGFRFNPHTGTTDLIHHAELSRDGKLRIPAQVIEAYGGAETVEIKLIAKRIDFTTRRVTGTDVAFLLLGKDYLCKSNEPAPKLQFEGAELSVNVPGKGTLVVALQIRAHFPDGASANRKFNAADIIAVQEARPLKAIPAKASPHKQSGHQHTDPTEITVPGADRVVLIQRE